MGILCMQLQSNPYFPISVPRATKPPPPSSPSPWKSLLVLVPGKVDHHVGPFSFCLSYWIVYCTAVNTNEPTAGADFQIVRLEALIRGIVDDLYRGSDITNSVMLKKWRCGGLMVRVPASRSPVAGSNLRGRRLIEL